jgi:hypothetical protein
MSFKLNTCQQGTIFDRKFALSERDYTRLESTWAEKFANDLFPKINESRFSVLYNPDEGRPNTPINVVVGALIIKELFGYTDDEMLDQVRFNIQIQNALRLTSADEIPFSDRTMSRLREKVYHHIEETGEDLIQEEVEHLAREAKSMLGIGDRIRRMDSLMISSHCKDMARLELVYTCTANLVCEYIAREGEGVTLPERLTRYTITGDKNATIYRAKGDEAANRLVIAVADAFTIRDLCGDGYIGCDAYDKIVRMLNEQTVDGKVKDGNQISPDSLQNPSDGDATYRKKAGKGYTGYSANVVEACGEDARVIESYDLQQNTYSDQEFGRDTVANLGEEASGSELIADGAYASESNFNAASEKGVSLIATCLTGKEPNVLLGEFIIENRQILRCPAGNVPYDTQFKEKTGAMRAFFPVGTCEGCPYREQCPITIQKKRVVVEITVAGVNRAVYAEKMQSKEFRILANKRNGVEGVPSVLRRKYRVDEMPIFGVIRSRIWFGFKVAALNAWNMFSVLKKRQQRAKGEVCPI